VSARRNRAVTKRGLAELQAPLALAQERLAGLMAQAAPLIIDVLLEEYAPTIARLRAAHAELIAAEAEAVGLGPFLAARGRELSDAGNTAAALPWFRGAEQATEAARTCSRPDLSRPAVDASTARWGALAARLTDDPSALADGTLTGATR
jgi:hypothetical protein